VTALGGPLFGYDTGLVSGALLFLKIQFDALTAFQQELVTSTLLNGAMTGVFGAGRVSDRIGRRPTIPISGAARRRRAAGRLLACLLDPDRGPHPHRPGRRRGIDDRVARHQ
jgi:MFS family permease